MQTKNRWNTLVAEFIIIVVGVLVALGVDDIRESREDRRLEEHLVARLLVDLGRDLEDLERVTLRARRRAWIADACLLGVGDPSAEGGTPYPSWTGEATPPSGLPNPSDDPDSAPLEEFHAGTEFDLSDATYSEMLATGSLRVIQSFELRGAIADYYFVARDFRAAEQRQGQSQEYILDAFQRVGIAPGDSLSLVEVIQKLQLEPGMATELRRFRHHVKVQLSYYADIRAAAQELLSFLQQTY